MISRDAALEAFARHEFGPGRRNAGHDLFATCSPRCIGAWRGNGTCGWTKRTMRAFGASVPEWPAFPDSAEALAYLKQHYQLVILSNVDRASFAGSNRRLGVTFDAIFTAEDIGSYKPDPRNFQFMLARLATARHRQGGHPAHRAEPVPRPRAGEEGSGWRRAWIDRRHDQQPAGARRWPPPDGAGYDFRFPSMAAMVTAHQAERAG